MISNYLIMKLGPRNLVPASPDSPQIVVSSNPLFDTSSESPDTWNCSSQSTPAATSRQASSPGDEAAEYTAVGAAIEIQEIATNLQDGNDLMSSMGPSSSEGHMYVQLSALRVALRLAEASLLDKDHELWHYMGQLDTARDVALVAAARQAELEQALILAGVHPHDSQGLQHLRGELVSTLQQQLVTAESSCAGATAAEGAWRDELAATEHTLSMERQIHQEEFEELANRTAQVLAECRALANQAADAQCAAVEAELTAASAREEARNTRSETAELYDTWRVRTEAAEAAARDSYIAAQGATGVAKEASLKLSEAMEKLTIAEDKSREAKDIVTWQEQRIAELEGRSSEQTCREYDAELISLREQFAARQSDLESEIVSLKLRIRESEMPKAAPYEDKGVKLESCWALDDILVAEGQIAKESARQIGDDRHSPDARAAFVELMATAVAQEKREGDRSCAALHRKHLQHVQDSFTNQRKQLKAEFQLQLQQSERMDSTMDINSPSSTTRAITTSQPSTPPHFEYLCCNSQAEQPYQSALTIHPDRFGLVQMDWLQPEHPLDGPFCNIGGTQIGGDPGHDDRSVPMEPPGAVSTPSETSSRSEVDAAQLLALLEALQEADGMRRLAECDSAECTNASDSLIGTHSQQPCDAKVVVFMPGGGSIDGILGGGASRLKTVTHETQNIVKLEIVPTDACSSDAASVQLREQENAFKAALACSSHTRRQHSFRMGVSPSTSNKSCSPQLVGGLPAEGAIGLGAVQSERIVRLPLPGLMSGHLRHPSALPIYQQSRAKSASTTDQCRDGAKYTQIDWHTMNPWSSSGLSPGAADRG